MSFWDGAHCEKDIITLDKFSTLVAKGLNTQNRPPSVRSISCGISS
uniref:Uncharacterized protein n=1 Tax=Lepeophtheirus salmonis TaxID=72036 RepID=A0A0K2TBU7_LEPSM